MERYRYQAVANGLRTDHPIPDLPFVDDAHIPVDNPQGIQAVGRHPGGETWGRQDRVREGGWVAFTTDPRRHDLSWCVRWHPDHGRSVILYRDDDASFVHMTYWGPALLYRAGGYWWDGDGWYRPAQVWDAAGETYVRRSVPGATTVSAADLLAGGGDAARGQVFAVADVDADTGRVDPARLVAPWLNELACWAGYRSEGARPLAACVVRVAAPELTGDELVSRAELAAIGGIAASTLRAYLARGEGDVPLPQASVGGRSVWSRPVAEDWAEQRRRSDDGVRETIQATRGDATQPPGIIDVWNRYVRIFMTGLWENPNRRRRWALRWRSEAAVRDIAEDLGWSVAADLTGERLVPMADLSITIRCAILDEFTTGRELDKSSTVVVEGYKPTFYGINRPIAGMLDWLIRHRPTLAASTIASVIGEAERRGIPRPVSEESIRTALSLDGTLDADSYQAFLERVLTPVDS